MKTVKSFLGYFKDTNHHVLFISSVFYEPF